MTTETKTDQPTANPQTPTVETRSPWQSTVHESFAVLLSLVVLVMTVWMMAATFSSGGETFSGDDKAVASRKEAYDRRKDIMLYSLSLLGTVTGYYSVRGRAQYSVSRDWRTCHTPRTVTRALKAAIIPA